MKAYCKALRLIIAIRGMLMMLYWDEVCENAGQIFARVLFMSPLRFAYISIPIAAVVS